jgi:hypothetical protein
MIAYSRPFSYSDILTKIIKLEKRLGQGKSKTVAIKLDEDEVI